MHSVMSTDTEHSQANGDWVNSHHIASWSIETKPGSMTVPSFGIVPTILDPVKGKGLEGNNFKGVLVLKMPWTAIACTVYKGHNTTSTSASSEFTYDPNRKSSLIKRLSCCKLQGNWTVCSSKSWVTCPTHLLKRCMLFESVLSGADMSLCVELCKKLGGSAWWF